MFTTSRDKRLYVTVRDPQLRTSLTTTIRGPGLSAQRILRLIERAVRDARRKAG